MLKEARAAARSRWNHWMRFLGVLACTVAAASFLHGIGTPTTGLGILLFFSLHQAMLVAILLFAPALTADCLSRERREGTLGLLFLTHLSSAEVVLGKGFLHMLRGVTLWLAALPVLSIAILLGGVSWLDVASAFTLQISLMILALGAGLLASSVCINPVSAIVVAEVLSFTLAWCLVRFGASAWLPSLPVQWTPGLPEFTPMLKSLSGALEAGNSWSNVLTKSTQFLGAWLSTLAGLFFGALLLASGCLKLASRRVHYLWHDKPLSPRQFHLWQFWFAPRLWPPRFNRMRGRILDRNPMGWLERHATRQRLINLACCAVVLAVDSSLMSSAQPWQYFEFVQIWLAILLTMSIASESATLFRRERESGALELLLVAPLSADELIGGRLIAFWRRFLWPVGLYVTLNQFMVWMEMATPPEFGFNSFLLVAYVTTPIIGFWLSLRIRSFISAFLALAVISVLLPVWMTDLWFLEPIGFSSPGEGSILRFIHIIQSVAGLACWLALSHLFTVRTFVAEAITSETGACTA